ncbi:hypothetical protein DM01DRAFT_1405855 [Hesseltinella vesiculosa]|uniref:Uncharacterized protein n=1 Tax=Hesseltinella vesiculosa TaxID=101127 RepID=A0A1X2GP81_9FUNG|nr:hypothetical protein DM01DRAFT_1405855 [Hesseltinella vesiculosa]
MSLLLDSGSSISSLHDGSSLPSTPPRFSVNSNLMNYSIPKHNALDTPNLVKAAPYTPYSTDRREIQQASTDTRSRHLESQIEQLTLSNVKLQRANRLLKVDTDNLIEEKTQPLRETIRELMLSNVQLQRSTRLLQQDLEEKTKKFEAYQFDQLQQMKNIGPEYEYLVQMINLLHRQLNGDANCESTCCYTLAPVDQSTVVMTLPPENTEHEEAVEAQHICRPIIHSSISQGSYAVDLEHKIKELETVVEDMELDKETSQRQLRYKEEDLQMLKKELQIKDEVISQLEQDFLDLEEKLASVQHKPPPSTHLSSPSPPPDPKRQSRLLMASKRRSLAIKDTDILEKMLRGDLDLHADPPSPPLVTPRVSESFTPQDKPAPIDASPPATPTASTWAASPTTPSTPLPRAFSNLPPFFFTLSSWKHFFAKSIDAPVTSVIPGDFVLTHTTTHSHLHTSYLFAIVTILLALASLGGITDDWTLPITLAVLVSSFLWSGGARGLQLKVKLN